MIKKSKSVPCGNQNPVSVFFKKVMQCTFDSVSIAPYILDVCNDLSFNYI